MALLSVISFSAKVIVAHLVGCFYAIPIVPFLLWSFIKNPSTFRILRKTTERPACIDDKALGKHDFANLKVGHYRHNDRFYNCKQYQTFRKTLSLMNVNWV